MNSQQVQEKPSRNWLRVTFFVSTCVFFLLAVLLVNKMEEVKAEASVGKRKTSQPKKEQ